MSYPVSLPIFVTYAHFVRLHPHVFLSLYLLPRSRSVQLYFSLSTPLPSSSCHGNWLRKIMQTYLALSEISLCLAHARLIA